MKIKSGLKTTEFWGTHLLSLGALLAALAGALPPKWAAISIAASEGLYALSRGLTKQGAGIGATPITYAPPASVPPASTSSPS